MYKTYDHNTKTYSLHYNDGIVVSTRSEAKFSKLVQQAKDNNHSKYRQLPYIVQAFIERSFFVTSK